MPDREEPDCSPTEKSEAALRDAAPTREAGRPPASHAEIRGWLLSRLAAALEVSESEVSADASFIALGLDSLTLFSMTGQLAEWLDRDLPATLLFEVSSLNELAEALASPNETSR
jgi:acyl carrier protein